MNGWVVRIRDAMLLVILVVGLSLALIAGLFVLIPHGEVSDAPPQTPVPQTHALASFTENDVTVEIAYQEDAPGEGWLEGTFTPTREGFHMYGMDLPKGGIQGVGRPTLMERVTKDGVKSLGTLTVNQPTIGQYTHALGFSVPVYPEGPVTLRVRMAAADLPNELAITYMTCSQSTCLAPVMEKRVAITPPLLEAR